jgi:hypothetical protein
MSFVTPLFWLGALVTAVPILLHLIKRENAQKMDFPTLMFLRKISKRTIRYQKLRHLLLLLARVAALLLLALAFMRPYIDRPQAASISAQATTVHVILLDNSMSMAYGDRWTRARRAASDIIRKAAPGDKVSLIEFSDRTQVMTVPSADFAVAQNVLDAEAALTDRPTRYGQVLKIAEKTALDAGAGKRVLYLISDFQKSGWATDEQDFRLDARTTLQCLDMGSDAFSNLALGEVQVIENEEDKGGGLRIRFSVINFGSEDRKSARVALTVDERASGEKLLDLSKGAVVGQEFLLPGMTAGVHNVALEIADANLSRDNRFAMTLQSRTKMQVFSVESTSSGKSGRAPSFFLANALNISALSPYKLAAVTPQQFLSTGALGGGLLIWNNAPAAGAAIQDKIRNFVKSGGGLIVVLADSAAGSDFNRSFGDWIPVKADVSAAPKRRSYDDYALLTDLRLDHPIFRPFAELHSGSFSTARFFDHARLVPSGNCQTLARFDNGDPALVAADIDKGRVLVLASSADDATNDLPLKSVYAPFWHQLLRYLENSRQEQPWNEVGDTITPKELLAGAAIREGKGNPDLSGPIVVMDPAKNRVPMVAGSDAVSLETAGFYDIRSSGAHASVAVNPSLRESDLTHGNAEEMASGWASKEIKTAEALSGDERPTPEDYDRRSKFWRYLLLAAAALLIFEALLANRLVLKAD